MTKKRKYNNRKVTYNGVTYDSVKEYKRHCDLALLERVGQITDLKRQVWFPLIPAQYEDVIDQKTGKKKRRCVEREIRYVADFTYKQHGKLIVEDVKGKRTPAYIMKRKLMLYFHGIRINEV